DRHTLSVPFLDRLARRVELKLEVLHSTDVEGKIDSAACQYYFVHLRVGRCEAPVLGQCVGEKASKLPTIAVVESGLDLETITILAERAEGLADWTGVGDKEIVIFGCGKTLSIVLADVDLLARRSPAGVNRLDPYRRSGRQNVNTDTGHAR
ncbi:MAG: hypothetical protein O7G83_06580, partial [Proteobacteria bacterium]|nr:hypothetical protein [Pseudomonadota bacterium]